jgi:hypothetical protein
MISTKRDNSGSFPASAFIRACAGVALLGCAMAGWGQQYYEASGQTAVFTLTPGAKSGPSSIRGRVVSRTGPQTGIRTAMVKGGLVVTLLSQRHGQSDISIYDMAGKQVYRQRGFSGSSLRFDAHRFAPGMYNLLVRIDGQNYSRRFAVSR